ncbi:phage portal protein [Streptomyces zaomyceticus]|uniref:phage portal protein n=1 Tax=Streptomyces zaomyceticus TaxID=68286 RepID=UPI00371257C5
MPLPDSNIPWPPPRMRPALKAMSTWDAWYGGDPDRLSALYGGGATGPLAKPVQFTDGWAGKLSRWWWGTPPAEGEQRTKIHVPLAGDICAASADMLFSEPPKFRAEDEATQKRVDQYMDDGMLASLQTAAEVGSALGGVYLRPVYDKSLRDRPWTDAVHHDRAVPEFKWGQLSAVTFWRTLLEDNGIVLRYLERHEPGRTYHGLYQGTPDKLGRAIPLDEHPATKAFATQVDSEGAAETGYDKLAVSYIPNAPSRQWRGIPALADLGRSDLEGLEPLLDTLDEVYASWMRDIRLAKGRLMVPNSMLHSAGPGRGASFNPDREILSGLEMLSRGGEESLTIVQFGIRVQEHEETANHWIDTIIRSAGYSPQTFGRGGDVAITATEVNAKERRSLTTGSKKQLRWRPGLVRQVEALLALDAQVFGAKVKPQPVDIEFGDSVQEDMGTLANTLETLFRAQAMSTQVMVETLHPEWDALRVKAETDRLLAETGKAVPDPMQLGDLP